MDDGGGCLISTEAVALIKYLGLKPKRSIQAVLWTSEEAGLYGAQDYARHHKDNMANIVAAFESDAGTFNPLGLDFEGTDAAGCIVNEILKLTDSIGTTAYAKYPSVSTDIRYLTQHGVPGLSLANKPTDGRDYFWYHHTEADTMTLLDSEELDKGMALWAVASYVIASLNDPLPRLNATATNFQF
jgi:carboxypeptidase Q